MAKVKIEIKEDGSLWIPFENVRNDEGCKATQHRAGTFEIHDDMINDPIVRAFFSRLTILRCEHDALRRRFIYDALSPYFRPVELSEVPPYYRAFVFTAEGDAGDVSLSFEFVEVNNG